MLENKYAFIRVSTEEQNEERQVIRMQKLGIPKSNIVIEKESGKSTERKKYNNLAKKLKKGDTLYIENIDRLSRDYDGILSEWHKLTVQKGVIIKILDTPLLDTDHNNNDLLSKFIRNIILHILAFQAENEWHKIKSRQSQGIGVMPIINGKRISTKTGRPTGRPKSKITKKERQVVGQYQNNEISASFAMALLEIKKTAFYNLCREIAETEY